jgi:hypothetical protein
MKICRLSIVLNQIVAYGIVVFVIIGLIAQIDSGLADNGDFTRAMTVFSSGPTDIYPNWPDPISQKELWERRFFKFYIPYWNLDYPESFSISRPFKSTAYLLWVPGIFLNRLFWSSSVLNLGIMSLPTRLFLIILVWLTIKWIRGSLNTAKSLILLLSFVGPIVAVILSPYNRYLNSFYYESAALFFVPLFLIILIIVSKYFSSVVVCLLVFTTSMLIAGAKAQWFYWPLVGALGCLIILRKRQFSISRSWGTPVCILLISIVLSLIALVFTQPPPMTLSINAYHRFFYGVLMLSSNSQSHLTRFGKPDLSECVGVHGYTGPGLECRQKAKEVTTWLNLAKVILHEPIIVAKMLNASAHNMHVIALPYLGIFNEHDPRLRIGSGTGPMENVWLTIKSVFPRGSIIFLWIVTNCFICCMFIKSKSDLMFGLGIVGFLSGIATILDMLVVPIGEGLYELHKHLFMANLMFDINIIFTLNVVFLYFLDKPIMAMEK